MTQYFRDPNTGKTYAGFEAWAAVVYPDGLPADSWLVGMLARFPNPSPSRLERWEECEAFIEMKASHYGNDPRRGWAPEPPEERVADWRESQALMRIEAELDAAADPDPDPDPEVLGRLSDSEIDAIVAGETGGLR